MDVKEANEVLPARLDAEGGMVCHFRVDTDMYTLDFGGLWVSCAFQLLSEFVVHPTTLPKKTAAQRTAVDN
jgi:hypothetical protein